MLVLDSAEFRLAPALLALRPDLSEVHLCSEPPDSPAGFDLALVHYDAFSPPMQAEILRRLDNLLEQGRVLAYLGKPSRESAALLLGEARVRHLFASELALDGEVLRVTVRKMLTTGGDIFGIDRYFADVACSRSLCVESTSHKAELMATAAAFARQVTRPERLVEQFTTTVDELVSNALYNAPVDESGRPRFAHLPRTEVVTLGPGERVDVELRSDGRRIGVSVADPFGTLTAEALIGRVGQRIGIPTGRRSSAGVGLFSVLSMVSHLAVNLAPAGRTEFVALMDVRGGSYRDFVRRGTAFNLFIRP